MAERDLEVVLRIKDKASRELKRLNQGFKRFGTTLDEVGRRAKTLAKISLPIVALGGVMTKMAMDAVESENLFTESMEGMAGSARKWSEDLREQLGLNAYEVRKNVATFNVMFTGMGLGKDAAFDLSKGLTQLAYDMASFRNLRPEEAFEKLRAGITGETEPLKRLGILVDEATVKTEALRMGLIKEGETLTQQGKVLARYSAIMRQTSKDQGDLARTLDSPTNQLRILGEQAKQVGIDLGMTMLPAMSSVMKELSPVVKKMGEWVQQNQDWLETEITTNVRALGAELKQVGGYLGVVAKIAKEMPAEAIEFGLVGYVIGGKKFGVAVAALITYKEKVKEISEAAVTLTGLQKKSGEAESWVAGINARLKDQVKILFGLGKAWEGSVGRAGAEDLKKPTAAPPPTPEVDRSLVVQAKKTAGVRKKQLADIAKIEAQYATDQFDLARQQEGTRLRLIETMRSATLSVIGTYEQQEINQAQQAWEKRKANIEKASQEGLITISQYNEQLAQNSLALNAKEAQIRTDAFNQRLIDEAQQAAEIAQLRMDVGEAGLNQVAAAEKVLRDAQMRDELAQLNLTEQQKFEIKEQYRLMDKQAEQRLTEEKIAQARNFIGEFSRAANEWYTAAAANAQNRMYLVRAEYEADLTAYKTALANKQISQEEFNRLGVQREAQFQAAKNKAYSGQVRKAWKTKQGIEIAETIINTYSAAMGAYKAMASIPYVGPYLGAAAAAAAVAAGFAKVRAIKSQQPPSYGEGGVVRNRTLAEVGERGPEAIIPLSRGRSVPVEVRGGGGEEQVIELTIMNVVDPRMGQPSEADVINVINRDILVNGITRQTIKRTVES